MWGRGSHRLLLRCTGNASKHEGLRSAAGRGRLHSWVENGWERQMQSGAELIQARQGTAVDKLGCSFAETRLGFSAGGRHGGGWRGGREQGVCIRLMTTGTDDPSSEAQHMRNSFGSDEGHSAEVGVTAAVVEGSALDGGNLPVTAAGAEEGSSTEFEDLAPTAAGAEGGTSSTSDEDVPTPAAGEEVSSTDDVVGLQAGDSVSSGSLHAEAANDPILGGATPVNAEDFTTSAEHERMIAGTGQAVDSVDATGATLQSTPDDLLTNPEEQEISESEEAKQKMAELAEELNKSLEDFKKARSHTAKVYVHIKSFEKIRPGGLTNVRSAGLPARRSLFTINRSPHVDKKARDQFQMKVHKHLLVIETETHKLHEKLHQLRNHDLPGVQLKVTFHYQTRLDMSKLA